MEYGTRPKNLGVFDVDCKEMVFYQYLPIKLIGQTKPVTEERLDCFEQIISDCCRDFISDYGLDKYVNSYVYLTAKRLYQPGGYSFNRKGYHSDGFMTDDINYFWSDKLPTIFNFGKFNISMDDKLSIHEMETQAKPENEHQFEEGSLVRLDQFVIHKVADDVTEGMRTFIKISFSQDKYDLIGNAKNHLLDYDWEMRERQVERNIPQEK